MPAIEARRDHDAKVARGVCPTVEEVYALWLLETRSEEQAEDAAREWANMLLRNDLKAG